MNDVPDIYANQVTVAASLYEVTLRFSLQTPGGEEDDDGVTSKEVARIRMSPQHAMALQILLGRFLKRYGEQFEEIFLPEELVIRLSGEEEEETT